MKHIIIICLLSLTACTYSTQTAELPPTEDVSLATPFPTSQLVVPSTSGNCYYVWAFQPLPELTTKVNNMMKELQPEASGRAQAYGENCVYANGHTDFTTMETDFYLMLNSKNLKDNDDLGNWIVKVMASLIAIPHGLIPGGQDGFAEIKFKSGGDQKILRVDIKKYKNLPTGMSGAELIKTLFSNP